jgi:uncharacterized protein YggE
MEKVKYRGGGEIVGAVVVFFVLLFVYTKIAGPIPFTVNNINTLNSTPFEATGTGKASAAPDKAVINMGVTQTGATVTEAQSKTNQVATQITASLKALGVDEKDIKTTNYSVNPDYANLTVGENQRITGYTVSQNFEVEIPIEKANSAVDAATAGGANLVGGITFTLDDETEVKLKNEARAEAVTKAKASAQGLAKASGIKLGNVINVRETMGGDFPMPMMARETVALDSKAVAQPATTITPGENNIEVSVVLTYQVL